MINSIKINFIKNLIKFTENIQALTNTDIYSIVRIKKHNNLKFFLDNNFSNSYLKWKENNKYLEKDLFLLHNISYNHWIRSYLATRISRNNKLLFFSCYLGIIKNFIFFIFFYIKVINSIIKFDRNIININNKDGLGEIKYEFLSSQKDSRFKEIASYLENNFNESIKYENIKFNYKIEIVNFREKDQNKGEVLNSVLKYCLKFPFMAKHYKHLFQGLYIHNLFKRNAFKKAIYSSKRNL